MGVGTWVATDSGVQVGTTTVGSATVGKGKAVAVPGGGVGVPPTWQASMASTVRAKEMRPVIGRRLPPPSIATLRPVTLHA